MLDKPPTYRSFLLTVWQEHSEGSSESGVWRFRLQDPRTGQRRGFADLEALTAALHEMVASEEGTQPHSVAQPGNEGRDPTVDT